MKPVIGVLCCNEVFDRPIQAVASRFIEPLSRVSGATVLLVPALEDVVDASALADRLDGLLLTGSRSNVAAARYGAGHCGAGRLDEQRDAVALALADRMIGKGRPVFGICRGLQELNVLFGGTLTPDLEPGRHHRAGPDLPFESLFAHLHDVTLAEHGLLASAIACRQLTVNSVHHQGIDRLGGGLKVEAVSSDDGLIEAFSANPCGATVLAVQWHPEWGGDPGLFESVMARPINLAAYGEPDAAALAASYAFGLARNHAFVDGNKRTPAVVSETFLMLNGWELTATDAELVVAFLALAAGELSEEELAAWFRDHIVAR